MNQAEDKFEIHYRQQLSALIDGDLAPDQARFLLRRLQHDSELNACLERWQLCGDVLRGQAQAPAPAGFAERVAAAIAAESGTAQAVPQAARAAAARPRRLLARWGGGALAASVALLALFVTRENVPAEASSAAMVASQAQTPAVPAAEPEATDAMATAPMAAATVASAVASRQSVVNKNRGSATRNQQVARAANARRSSPPLQRATGTTVPVPATTLVAAAPASEKADPFRPTQAVTTPAARPWPKSSISGYPSASGAFNASFGAERSGQSFHPFEPRLQSNPPVPVPVVPEQ